MGFKIKGIFILAVLVGSIAALSPTYQAYRAGADPATIKNKVNLGLDLQGGMYLDLEVDSKAAVERVLDRLAEGLEDALLDKLVDYLSVERTDLGVEVTLGAGEEVNWNEDPFSRLLNTFSLENLGTGRFKVTLTQEEATRIERNSVTQALEVLRNRIDSLGVSEPSLQRKGESDLIVQLPGLKDRESALAAIGTPAVLEFYLVEDNVTTNTLDPSRHVVKYQEVRDPDTKKVLQRTPFVLQKRAVLSGESVRKAVVQISNFDNQPYVGISFDSTGSDRFASITSRSRGRRLAIVLDDKVQSAPVIREAITGGEAQISGQFTMSEANNLAIVLNSGSLPAPLIIREERTVGATLGEDSIQQGISSLLAGMAVVMVFMIVYYRVAGAFACFALIFNLVLIMVALALVQATLTLPGIAGIVLTTGMSVDANVLIFERIREEIRRDGKNLRSHVKEGYEKAFWTIFDANITTLVAAAALLFFGTGPIKGFAITLSFGILASMFTAIYVTRFLFELVYLNRKRLGTVHI